MTDTQADDLKRTVVWKNLVFNSRDYCALWHAADGWFLKGTVAGVLKNQRPMLANYEVYCDENWLTRRVQVECTVGNDVKTLTLSVGSRGVWCNSGQELREIRDCDDVDLSITPATNTLPIRRLNLQIGSSENVVAAWIKFPELTVEPLSQSYTRLSKDTYRYESNTGFSTEIVVDEFGLVTAYPDGWERIAMV